MSGGLSGLVVRRTKVVSTQPTILYPRSKKAAGAASASAPPTDRSTSDQVRDGTSSHNSIVRNAPLRNQRIFRKSSTVEQAITEITNPSGQAHSALPLLDPAISAKHLIRSLLRECSYLPDAHARRRMKEYILERHRRLYSVRYSSRDPKSPIDVGAPIPKSRNEADAFDQGRKWLRQLQSANAGNLKTMLKVLAATYGRTGRRRHELLAPLLKSEGEDKVFGLPKHDPDTANDNPSDNRSAVEHFLTSQLQALAHSQVQTSIPNSFRKTLRSASPSIPATNAWQRPMPRKRVRNLEKEWYATLLDRVHAPLPVDEWHRLSSLATEPLERGVLQPPRRTRAGLNTRDNDNDVARSKSYSILETVVMRGKVPLQSLGPDRSNQLGSIDARSMRRLWRRIFAVCPTMVYNAVTERWEVTWGAQKLSEMARNEKGNGYDGLQAELDEVEEHDSAAHDHGTAAF